MPEARLAVRVTSRTDRNEITAVTDGVVHVRVTAPPVEGAANEAVMVTLAKVLGRPRTDLCVRRGAASRLKCIGVAGISTPEALDLIRGKLSMSMPSPSEDEPDRSHDRDGR